MKLAIASDHAGYRLKNNIVNYLAENHKEIEVCDFTKDYIKGDDYPEYAQKVAKAVTSGECARGIVICGTGMGISIAANKAPGIRAAACYTSRMAEISREHNDSNVLALGGRITACELAFDIVESWLNTEFSGCDRHKKRIEQIGNIEKEYKHNGTPIMG
ncbi:ribose 5-phosphate isomerase B [Candidatus Poribacteria bacterium]|nr:ribose 5-phosphate isomerase B [Candidatus Poribacteria bacterium]